MKYHHTKTLGDLGVLKAQLDLFKKGYIICIPLTEHSPFDLIVYKNNKCYTIQVKSRNVNKNGLITVQFRSIYSDSNGTHSKTINKNDINFYCIYCPQTDECYYFNPKKYKRSISLRVEKSKINNSKIKFIKDYKIIKT